MKKTVNILFSVILLMTAFMINAHATDVTPIPTTEPTTPTVVTLKAPTASIESGKVSTSTTVSFTSEDGLVAFSINGEDFVYRESSSFSIAITDNMTIVVKSWLQTPDPDTEYIFEEATYTYILNEKIITGTVTLPDRITAPEGGIKVNIIAGHLIYYASSVEFVDKYILYDGVETSIPDNTMDFSFDMSNIAETSVIIPYGENSVSFLLTLPSEYPSIDLAYYIENDMYMGNGVKRNLSKYKFSGVKLQPDCYKIATINGTVTIPVSNSNTTITVVAEGDMKIKHDEEDDSYYKSRSFVDTQKISIPAGKTTVDYSLSVKEDMEYTVYVVFENEKYKRPVQTVNVTTGEYTIDFDTFEKSNKISGTIKLPEEITELQEFDGAPCDYISAYIRLQSASAPYYYLDTYEITIDAGKTSAYFELYDDIGVEDVFISYALDSVSYKNLYYKGVYVDDTKSVPNIKHASTIKSENKDITLNIIKANTIIIHLENKYDTLFYIDAIVQKDKNNLKDEENCELIEDIWDADSETGMTFINIPEDYDYFVLLAEFPRSEETAYLTENGYTKNINKAKVFSSETDIDMTLEWNGFDPIYPIHECASWRSDEDEFYKCSFNIINQSDFAKENVRMYSILFDDDGQFIGAFVNDPFSIESKEEQYHAINIPTEDYNKAEEIYVMFWDGVKPLSEKFTVKQP